jgi:hypothetical protein
LLFDNPTAFHGVIPHRGSPSLNGLQDRRLSHGSNPLQCAKSCFAPFPKPLGVETITGLHPAACGIIIQENPEGMTSAITPGRPIPPSIAKAVEIAHATLVPRQHLIEAFAARGYRCKNTWFHEVADGKRLVAVLFVREEPLSHAV